MYRDGVDGRFRRVKRNGSLFENRNEAKFLIMQKSLHVFFPSCKYSLPLPIVCSQNVQNINCFMTQMTPSNSKFKLH